MGRIEELIVCALAFLKRNTRNLIIAGVCGLFLLSLVFPPAIIFFVPLAAFGFFLSQL